MENWDLELVIYKIGNTFNKKRTILQKKNFISVGKKSFIFTD